MIALNHLKVSQAVDLYLTDIAGKYESGHGVSSHWHNIASAFRRWVVPQIGERWLYELNSSLVRELQRAWIDSGKLKVSSINRHLSFVHDFARFCEQSRLIGADQLTSILNVRRIKPGHFGLTPPDQIRPLGVDQVRATIEAMEPAMARALRLLLLTGMRPIELRRMTLGELYETVLDGEPAMIYRPSRHKTARFGKTKRIAIVRDAYQVLLEQLKAQPPAQDSPGYIFSREGLGFAMLPDPAIRQAVVDACARIGIPAWTPYRLRHTHASIARANGVAMRTISVSLGHSSTRTTEIYAEEPDQEAIRAALAISLPNL